PVAHHRYVGKGGGHAQRRGARQPDDVVDLVAPPAAALAAQRRPKLRADADAARAGVVVE
nr:hypothetical protein [Tanacetum cinerariifolium]